MKELRPCQSSVIELFAKLVKSLYVTQHPVHFRIHSVHERE